MLAVGAQDPSDWELKMYKSNKRSQKQRHKFIDIKSSDDFKKLFWFVHFST